MLVFGTPILLIWGLEYTIVLGLLLPSSVMISILQITHSKSKPIVETQMAPLAILGIIFGSLILVKLQTPTQMPMIMTITMLSVAILRSIPSAINWVSYCLYRQRFLFHFMNATLHGITNQGGVLLTFYSTFVYKEKFQALRCTSFFYLIYATAQIVTLIVLGELERFFDGFLFMPIAAMIYLFLENGIFKKWTRKFSFGLQLYSFGLLQSYFASKFQ